MQADVDVDDPWFAEVLVACATLEMLAGRPEAARTTFERAVAWEREGSDDDGLARALSAYAMALSQCGEMDLAFATMDESVTLRRQSKDRQALAHGLRRLGEMEFLRARPRRSAAYADEAATVFGEIGDEVGRAIALYQLGIASSEVGENDRARAALEEALEIDSQRGDAMRATLEQTVLAVVEYEMGNHARSLELFDAADRAQRDGGLLWYRALTLVNRGLIEHATGALDAARASFQLAGELAVETQNDRVTVLARYHEAAIHAVCGDPQTADDLTAGLVPHRADAEVVALLSAIVAIAQHEDGGDPAAAARAVELYSANAAGDVKSEPVTAHWRIVSSIAEEFLTRCGQPVGRTTLVATVDGARFRAPGGRWVDMRGKRVLRRLFAALLEHRLAAPGSPLSAEELARAAWPRADFDAAMSNRLYVSISKLRDLGLRDILLSDAGYLLDPGIAVLQE